MKKLEKRIASLIVYNLELTLSDIDRLSISACSEIIAKEWKASVIEYFKFNIKYSVDYHTSCEIGEIGVQKNDEELFDQFIKERYKP